MPELPDIEARGREIVELRRLGKRIAIGLAGELWLMLHLMIAGRRAWPSRSATPCWRSIWPRSRWS